MNFPAIVLILGIITGLIAFAVMFARFRNQRGGMSAFTTKIKKRNRHMVL